MKYFIKCILFQILFNPLVFGNELKSVDLNPPELDITRANSNPISPGKQKIVGGSPAKPNEFPWMVVIKTITTNSTTGRPNLPCGGSILNRNWIVTSAHCLNGDKSNYRIVGGAHDLTRPSVLLEQRRTISEIWIHPLFDETTSDNDVALAKVNVPFIFFPMGVVQPIKLGNVGCKITGNMITMGWGTLREQGTVHELPGILQRTTIVAVDQETCRRSYEGYNTVTDRMLCASGIGSAGSPGRDSCSGDGGGPLLCPNTCKNEPFAPGNLLFDLLSVPSVPAIPGQQPAATPIGSGLSGIGSSFGLGNLIPSIPRPFADLGPISITQTRKEKQVQLSLFESIGTLLAPPTDPVVSESRPDPGVSSLCGISSWGQGCGRAGKPGVYTNLLEFREWINTMIQT